MSEGIQHKHTTQINCSQSKLLKRNSVQEGPLMKQEIQDHVQSYFGNIINSQIIAQIKDYQSLRWKIK